MVFASLFVGCSSGGDDASGGEAPSSEIVLGPLPSDPGEISSERVAQGGATTTSDRTTLAFENPIPNISGAALDRHFEGDTNFGAIFVTPPATFNAGLGPTFNNNSCDGCHTKNGRGQPVTGTGARGTQALLRVSMLDGASEFPGSPGAVPGLGTQIQDHSVIGETAEGTVSIEWHILQGRYGDGTSYELRRPKFTAVLSDGNELGPEVMTSFRVPPPVFGLGLLEAVPQSTIEALSDPGDANGDGISGRPNYVWDVVRSVQALGRFGRKANTANLLEQNASAYAHDIGVTNPLFPGVDGSTEIGGDTLASVEFYTQSIAVPRAGNIADPIVKKGEGEFLAFQCAGCHIPELRTGSHKVSALSNQTIFPYTDLLLHDMGPDLADNRPDFLASGTEWRTTPLWGIGVTVTILSNTATFLHDGRARTLEEAILWHGGEAEVSRERFRRASSDEREALIAFLRSL